MIKIKRKKNEGFERLIRRFNRSVQLSGVLTTARKKRFFEKEPNKTARRSSAKRREGIQEMRKKRSQAGMY
ncbi:MAG: 30S ribosomal protein S21 [bacterium]